MNFPDRFLKTIRRSNVMKNLSVEAELFHVHGHIDRQTWWC